MGSETRNIETRDIFVARVMWGGGGGGGGGGSDPPVPPPPHSNITILGDYILWDTGLFGVVLATSFWACLFILA